MYTSKWTNKSKHMVYSHNKINYLYRVQLQKSMISPAHLRISSSIYSSYFIEWALCSRLCSQFIYQTMVKNLLCLLCRNDVCKLRYISTKIFIGKVYWLFCMYENKFNFHSGMNKTSINAKYIVSFYCYLSAIWLPLYT